MIPFCSWSLIMISLCSKISGCLLSFLIRLFNLILHRLIVCKKLICLNRHGSLTQYLPSSFWLIFKFGISCPWSLTRSSPYTLRIFWRSTLFLHDKGLLPVNYVLHRCSKRSFVVAFCADQCETLCSLLSVIISMASREMGALGVPEPANPYKKIEKPANIKSIKQYNSIRLSKSILCAINI